MLLSLLQGLKSRLMFETVEMENYAKTSFLTKDHEYRDRTMENKMINQSCR